MTDLATRFDLHTREFKLQLRADSVDADKGIVRGIAVPYDAPVRIRDWAGEYDEQFARGSVDDADALAFWRHSDPIGVLVDASEVDAGREVSLRISDTTQGRDALTLARDLAAAGRPMELSVGFEPGGDYTVTERDNDVPLITRTSVKVREVSLVPFGAYGPDASVSEVRERTNNNPAERDHAMTDTTTAPDLIEVRDRIDELERRQASLLTRTEEPITDTRSAGEVLKAIVSGDETTIRAYGDMIERAYTGGTSADAVVKPGWVGDLTRIFDASSGVLAATFSTGTLPATGNSIEFAELSANTLSVAEQVAEGDDIAAGKVTITTRTAPVKTYAGSTSLTRQEVERATVGVLNTSLNGLAIAAGAQRKAYLRTAYEALVTAREGIASNGGVVLLGATLAAATASNWEDALVDAALRFEAINLPLERMLVSATVFKKLRSLTVSGERVFQTSKDNASGTLDLPGLSGDFASVPVLLDSGATGDKAAFVNSLAVRQYNSPLVQLSDEAISNLTKSFAIYAYGATAAEIPAGVIPVKLAAS